MPHCAGCVENYVWRSFSGLSSPVSDMSCWEAPLQTTDQNYWPPQKPALRLAVRHYRHGVFVRFALVAPTVFFAIGRRRASLESPRAFRTRHPILAPVGHAGNTCCRSIVNEKMSISVRFPDDLVNIRRNTRSLAIRMARAAGKDL
jgi:hypothetical protein